MTGSKLLAFVEDEAQAASAPADALVVALSSEAEYALLETGRPYRVPDDYFEAEELRAVKEESLRRVYAFCETLDPLAAEALSIPGFKAVSLFQFSVRHLFDHAFYTAWRARRVLEREPGAKAVFFETAEEPLDDGLFFRRESVWSRVLPLVARESEVLRSSVPRAPSRSRPALRSRLGALARSAASLLKPEPAGGCLYLTRNYSLGALMDETGGALWRADMERPSPAADDARAMEGVWKAAVPELRRLLTLDRLDLFPVCERRLSFLLRDAVPAAAVLRRAADRRLARAAPRVVLAGTMNWREKTVASAARARGIPFAVYLHGNIGTRRSEIVRDNDLAWSDLYLVGGAAHKEYCALDFPREGARVEAVGSVSLERLGRDLKTAPAPALRRDLGIPADKPVVIYALNAVRDFRFPQYHRTDAMNFKVQRAIVETLARLPVTALIKLYSGDVKSSPIGRWLADKSYSNVRALSEPAFSKLLPLGDAFVIDFPSTTLVEMALTEKPIVFVDALTAIDWLPAARAAVAARAEFCSDLPRVDEALKSFAAGSLRAKTDRRLLLGYGLCADDGANLARAKAAVASLSR